jgi:peroxisomal 3,2-trans-enoyl-CoA isomerase
VPSTPFSKLGQSPEGCSSYLFPKLMGSKRANEILLLDGVLTAGEAKQAGLVTEVFPPETFRPEVSRRLQEMSKLPPKTMVHIKKLVRDVEREKLHQGPIL